MCNAIAPRPCTIPPFSQTTLIRWPIYLVTMFREGEEQRRAHYLNANVFCIRVQISTTNIFRIGQLCANLKQHFTGGRRNDKTEGKWLFWQTYD